MSTTDDLARVLDIIQTITGTTPARSGCATGRRARAS